MTPAEPIALQELWARHKLPPSTDDEASRYEMDKWRRFWPIAECDQLYLRADGHGDEARFTALFRRVWLAIPVEDRSRMSRYWVECGHAFIPGLIGPTITLEASASMRRKDLVGSCSTLGSELKFYAPVLDRMPDTHVHGIIAHELGHVWHWSGGEAHPPEPPTDEFRRIFGDRVARKFAYGRSPGEREADATAQRWGFDPNAAIVWATDQVDWEALPPDRW